MRPGAVHWNLHASTLLSYLGWKDGVLCLKNSVYRSPYIMDLQNTGPTRRNGWVAVAFSIGIRFLTCLSVTERRNSSHTRSCSFQKCARVSCQFHYNENALCWLSFNCMERVSFSRWICVRTWESGLCLWKLYCSTLHLGLQKSLRITWKVLGFPRLFVSRHELSL